MVDNVYKIGLIECDPHDVLLIIDNTKKQKGYNFNMVKAAGRIKPNMSLQEYERDNILDLCVCNYGVQTYYFVNMSNELFFTGYNQYPKLYPSIPLNNTIPIKVDSNIIQIEERVMPLPLLNNMAVI